MGKNIVMADVSIVPLGTAETSVSDYVASSLEVLKKAKDLQYQVGPMGTSIQGPMDRVMEVIAQMHETPFGKGVKRVVTIIKIDDRRDKQQTLTQKVRRVTDRS